MEQENVNLKSTVLLKKKIGTDELGVEEE